MHRRTTAAASTIALSAALAATLVSTPAKAQRATENATARAEDAFGTSIGGEQIGIYSPGFVRGFSALEAGNVRLGGLYIDQLAPFNDRLVSGLQMRVGLSAQSYPFPAPTGVAEYAIRTPGRDQVISTQLRVGPLGGIVAEVDAQQPLGDTLSLGAGIGVAADQTHYGADPLTVSTSLMLRWTPSEDIEITPFWSRTFIRSDEAQPLFQTDGTGLPPRMERGRLLGQDWAENRGETGNAGVVARVRLGDWTIRGGLFRSEFDYEQTYVQLFLNVDPITGQAIEGVISEPRRTFVSISGELRVSRSFVEGNRLHTIHGMVRGRDRQRDYGGGSLAVLGVHRVQEPVAYAKPTFTIGGRTRDEVRQTTFGLAYELRWRDVGEFSIGLQQTDYAKSVITPRGPLPDSTDTPLLLNVTAAWFATPALAFYAGYTEGLEESPVAPDIAVNRDEAPPALRTRQVDGGLRWTIRPGMRLVLGAFRVEKPYFNLDTGSVFRQLGDVTHSGVEFSFIGQITPEFLAVVGTSVIDPQVSGPALDAGIVGPRPVASFRRLSTAVVQYRPSWWAAASFDLIVESSSDRVANSTGTLFIPERTTISLGARYRFMVGEAPANLRILLGNVTDLYGYGNTASGLFVLNQPRRLSVTFTVDW